MTNFNRHLNSFLHSAKNSVMVQDLSSSHLGKFALFCIRNSFMNNAEAVISDSFRVHKGIAGHDDTFIWNPREAEVKPFFIPPRTMCLGNLRLLKSFVLSLCYRCVNRNLVPVTATIVAIRAKATL